MGNTSNDDSVLYTHNGIVRAVCVRTYDNYTAKEVRRIKEGEWYSVEYIIIGSSWSRVILKELSGYSFRSGHFDFYINGKKFNPIHDVRTLWYISQPEMRSQRTRIFRYPSATEESIKFTIECQMKIPIIDRMKPLSDIEISQMPIFDINPIKEFALDGWVLGDTHGLPHWQRVERNGIILSTGIRNGKLCIRDGINIRVVRLFAYLHDKCRINNAVDLKHGGRAADRLYSIKDTLLKDLTDEEFSLLEKACRLHTVEHRTGNPTIDTCFDADRLDLDRVGIEPDPQMMATSYGEYYASGHHIGTLGGIYRTIYRHLQ